jgi:hypothetical protein
MIPHARHPKPKLAEKEYVAGEATSVNDLSAKSDTEEEKGEEMLKECEGESGEYDGQELYRDVKLKLGGAVKLGFGVCVKLGVDVKVAFGDIERVGFGVSDGHRPQNNVFGAKIVIVGTHLVTVQVPTAAE